MKVSELINSIRIAIDDTNATTYSDYTVLNVLNSIFSNVVNFLNKNNSTLFQKEIRIDFVENSATLPEDFVGLISVTDDNEEPIAETSRLSDKGYKVVGNLIKSKLDHVNVIYSCLPIETFSMESIVPFPAFMFEYLKKYIVMVLTNDDKSASITILPVIEKDVIELLANREHAVVERPMQFTV